MTKRRLLAIIIILAMCVSLCACSAKKESDTQSTNGTFVVVTNGKLGNQIWQTILYDPDTLVMYTFLDGSYSGNMSVLYNADGTLKLYFKNAEAKTFVLVTQDQYANGFTQTIMYDPDTKVMYTHLDGSYSGTMSVLYNADGTLKLYSPKS